MAEWLACRAFLLITVKRSDGRRVGSNPARVQVVGGFIPQRVSLDEKTSLIWLKKFQIKKPRREYLDKQCASVHAVDK